MEDFLKELERQRTERNALVKAGVPALVKLAKVARGDSGQCHHVRRFLLGLYNSTAWPFELNRLRGLDRDLQEACFEVLRLDAIAPAQEIHKYLTNGDELFRSFWDSER